MKSILFAILLMTSAQVLAAANQLGLGVMLGNPTGLNGKYWLDNKHAVDGGAAFAFGKRTNLSLHSDYLFHSEEAFYYNDVHPLDFYFGLGGRMEFGDAINLGIRLPVGLVHRMKNDSADIFTEIAPILDFIGRSGLDLHLAVGARYYF